MVGLVVADFILLFCLLCSLFANREDILSALARTTTATK